MFVICNLSFLLQLTRKDGKLYGRGSSDDKGPVLGWMHAIEAYQKSGIDLPVNVKFCFEGLSALHTTRMVFKIMLSGQRKPPHCCCVGIGIV